MSVLNRFLIPHIGKTVIVNFKAGAQATGLLTAVGTDSFTLEDESGSIEYQFIQVDGVSVPKES